MRKIISIFLALATLLTTLFLYSCSDDPKPEEEVIDMHTYTLHTNASYGDDTRHLLDVAVPEGKKGETVGVILMIHGGGWISGDKEIYYNELKKWANDYGYIAAAINYRYADGDDITTDDMLSDIDSALSKIKSIAKSHGVTAGKALLTGGSAGGHLSLLYAYKCGETAPIKPAAVVSHSGPTDLCDANFYKENGIVDDIVEMIGSLVGEDIDPDSYTDVKDALVYASPTSYVSTAVPTVICHGTLDSIVPVSNAYTLDALLTEAGVTHELIIFENSNHGLESDPDASALAAERMYIYARKYL